ncbi:MAG: alpha/beta fold hydrolase [Acidimicrobiales bacterium]
MTTVPRPADEPETDGGGTSPHGGTRLPGTPEPGVILTGFGGVPLAADVAGDHGPLVLLLHGGGQTRHAWKGAGERLAGAGYRTVSLDARGHGDSGWAPDGDYTTEAMMADLAAVIDHYGETPVLVGASMGGGTSLTAIGEDVVTARALVLVDTAPRVEAAGIARIRDFMAQAPDGFGSLEEVAEAIATYQPHRPRPRRLDGLAKNVRQWPDGRYRWHWDPAYMRRPKALADRIPRQEAAADRLRELGTHTLLVRGGLSDVLSEAGAAAFLAQVPDAAYANVGEAAHMVAGDRNDVFVDAVVDFLARVVPPGG